MAPSRSPWRACARSPNKLALICGDQTWTYAELDAVTDRLARGLRQHGLAPGDRVALHLANSPELVIGCLGAFKAGAVVVPLDTRLKTREIGHILHDGGVRLLVTEPDGYAQVVPLRVRLPSLELCLVGDPSAPNGTSGFQELLAPAKSKPGLPVRRPSQPAVLLFTSGETARPKGVTYTLSSLHRLTSSLIQIGLTQDRTLILPTPITQSTISQNLLFAALAVGASVVLLPQAEPSDLLRALALYPKPCTFATPSIYRSLIECASLSPETIGSDTIFLAEAETVSPGLRQQASERFASPLLEFFWLPEVGVVTWNPPGDARPGSLGIPLEGVAVRVAKPWGDLLAPNEVDELIVTSPGTFAGYWMNHVATTHALRRGEFYTRCLGRVDPEGYYWFAGRDDDAIVRDGSVVSPAEVEEVLYRHPAVAEVGVVGAAVPILGEEVVAVVALRVPGIATEAELIDFARARLADYKVPQRILFKKTLPKKLTGKVARHLLKE